VICGHIHKAEIRQFDDILYVNDGDWVESCTAIAEREDGELILLDWSQEQKRLPRPARQGLVTIAPESSLAA
jgi:predicted phosphodiesterase